jgi:hypothetical protein
MIKHRPRVRYDGIYIGKMSYTRFGINETSEYRPYFNVCSYKYLYFMPNGYMIYVYSTMTPRKFVPKFQKVL